MSDPVIITVAITGSMPRKKDNQAVPISPAEQIESTHESFEAGASVVHIHVRNEDESPSSDPELFAEVQAGIIKHCPGMIIQFSTGGRGRLQSERGAMLHLKPDMASLATGSVNFPNLIYENPPQLIDDMAATMVEYKIKPEIEIFDLSMLYNAAGLYKEGKLLGSPHVQFVMGIKNAMPVRRSVFEFLLKELKDVMPDATWTAAGIGRNQLELNKWSLENGGHCRTGLEDNLKLDKDTLAASNAQLVARLASLCSDYGRAVATPEEARKILGLPLSGI